MASKTANVKKMSVAKKITIILAAILTVIMAGVCAWWICLYFFAPQKIVSSTYNVGTITDATGSKTKNIIEIKYMSNKKHNGYELLDIRYNYFSDESQKNIYSQGLQYVANSANDTIDFDYVVDGTREKTLNDEKSVDGWYNARYVYDVWGAYMLNSQRASSYNYASTDEFNTTLNSTNPLDYNSKFLVTIGEDLYKIQFKGRETLPTKYEYESYGGYVFFLFGGVDHYEDYYAYQDFNYFAKIMYEALQTEEYGINKPYVLELPDMFLYYKCTDKEAGVYNELPEGTDESGKLVREISNYYSIKITISEDGAQKSEDSLFNCVHGNSNWNINPNRAENDEHFTGRSIISCTLSNFDLVTVYDNQVALKLKDGFVNSYLPYKDTIMLDVEIDLDQLQKLGYEYFGLAKDSGLDKFKVYRVRTVEIKQGQKEYGEVVYEG